VQRTYDRADERGDRVVVAGVVDGADDRFLRVVRVAREDVERARHRLEQERARVPALARGAHVEVGFECARDLGLDEAPDRSAERAGDLAAAGLEGDVAFDRTRERDVALEPPARLRRTRHRERVPDEPGECHAGGDRGGIVVRDRAREDGVAPEGARGAGRSPARCA
jgi:hypothetical protein